MRSGILALFWFVSSLSLPLGQLPPLITSQPQGQTVDQGGTVSFSVTATGSGTLTYQWFKAGVPLANATASTLTLTNLQPSDAASYTVMVANAYAIVTSDAATLVVLPTPVVTAAGPATGYVGLPFQGALAAINGPASYRVTGLPPGLAIDSASGLISGVPTTAGTYALSITGTNSSGVGIPFPFALTIQPTPFVLASVAGPNLIQPNGLAVDSSGNLYVADSGASAIFKVAPNGAVATLAGSPGQTGSADGAGTLARFNAPEGLASDSLGNVYVADTGNDTIRVITPGGLVSTLAGTATHVGSSDGTGGGARFNGPTGVAIDTFGNLYVADTGNQTIRKMNLSGSVSTFAGLASQGGNVDALGTGARFNSPNGIAVDGGGAVYVNDFGNQSIRKISASGSVSTLVAGGSLFPGGYSPYGTPFNGLAVDGSGNVFAASGPDFAQVSLENYGFISAIFEIGSAGNPIPVQQWTGTYYLGNPPPVTGQVYVTGIAVDRSNAVYFLENSAIEKLTLASGPSIGQGPQSQGVIVGQNVVFTVTATANPTPAYQWAKNGAAISGATASTLSLSNVQLTDSGSYTATVSTTYGAVTSTAATLTVNPPATISTQPQNQTAFAGSTVTYSVTASNGTGYQWLFNGTAIAGATNPSLVLANVNSAQAGAYSVVVFGVIGSVTSGPAALTVLPTPPTSLPGYVGIPFLFTIPTTFTPTGYSVSGLPPGLSLNPSTGAITGSPTAAGTYAVTLAASNGTVVQTRTLTLNITPASPVSVPGIVGLQNPYGPVVSSQPQSQAVSPGQPVSFSVVASGVPVPLSYQWQLNGVAIAGATNATVSLPSATLQQAGVYTVLVSTSDGTVSSSPATLSVSPAPVIVTQPQSQSVAAGSNVTLGVTASTGAAYQWQLYGSSIAGATSASLTLNAVTSAQAGAYTVVVTLGASSVTSNPAVVQVLAPASTPPVITKQPGTQSVYLGTTATLSVAASGTGQVYQWQKNGVPISGATNSTFTIAAAQASDAGIYAASVKNAAGSVTTTPVALGVNLAPGAAYLNSWNGFGHFLGESLFTSVAFNGSVFVLVGANSSIVEYDGTLGFAGGAITSELNFLGYAGAPFGFMGVGNNGAIFSFNGPPFSGAVAQSSGTPNALTGFAAGGSRMVAVGYAGAAISSSSANAGWVPGFSGTSSNLNAVTYGNGLFVAVGMGGTVITSADSLVWTPQALGSATDLYGIACGPAGFVAIGNASGSGVIFTSPDAVSWTPEPTPANSGLNRVIYANGAFVAVGYSGVILTSTDGGFTWVAQNSGTTANLHDVAFGLNTFLAVGDNGTFARTAVASSRLVNTSTLTFVGSGSSALVAGFATSGTGSKQVLVRGIGPTLTQFGVSNVLNSPQLTLYNSSGAAIASNSGWGGGSPLSAVFSQVGAFALPVGSADTAIVQSVPPGSYTAQVSGANNATGVALIEVYDADTGTPNSRLVNISTRAFVGTGANVLVAGFVVSGNTADTVLIRGDGPALSAFGLSGVLSTPLLTLYDSAGNVVASNAGWGGSAVLSSAFAAVGAFSLPANSADCALKVALPPGNYTAQVSGANGTTGIGLVELYELP